MKRVLLLGIVLAGFGVAGCGVDADQSPPAAGEPELAAIPTIADYADVEFPLDKFRTGRRSH